MTEKLYYIDSHMHEFEASVLECESVKNGYAVILDRSAFFPEGGGQAADTGFIGDAAVLDVQEKSGRHIHYTASPLSVGESYSCRIDWEKRLRRMQNHSGEHIVSGLVHSNFGLENVGFHMGEDCMTIDFSGELDEEQLSLMEQKANEAVRSNLPIYASFPHSAALEKMDYRSKLELRDNVRIVEIEGIDRCACCAPHVSNTGEIGFVKFVEHTRHRGGIRLSLVCGMDALDYVNKLQNAAFAVSRLLSAKRHEIDKAVERILSEQQKAKERISTLSMEHAKLKAAAFEAVDGNICVFDEVLDEVALRELVNMLTAKCTGLAAAFSGNDEEGYRYIISSKNIDLRAMTKAINQGIGGRGGGSSEMIQGRASQTAETIHSFIMELNV